MKIKTVYTCELCGTSYNDKNRAEQCEKTHKTGLKIVGAGYLPHEHNAKGFPNIKLHRAYFRKLQALLHSLDIGEGKRRGRGKIQEMSDDG